MKNKLIRPVEKNQNIELTITSLNDKGEGVGRFEGFTVMVPGLLEGERARVHIVQVRSRFAYGKVVEILTESSDRIVPKCSLDQKCGGCQIGHMSYEKQLRFKQERVIGKLEQIGHFTREEIEKAVVGPVLGMQGGNWEHYRNKAQFPVQMIRIGKTPEEEPILRAEAGFYAPRSHRLMPVYDCLLQSKRSNELIEKIMNKVRKDELSIYEESTGNGLLRHVLIRTAEKTGECSVCFVINGDVIPEEEGWSSFMKENKVTGFSLNTNRERTNIILGKKTRAVYGELYIQDKIGEIVFQISPVSFYQVNPQQTEVLYKTALEFADLSKEDTVWDAYCGIGTISLFLASKAKKVYGVEVVPQAIENARENARLNQIENAEFFVGKAEEVIPEKYEKEGIATDIVVVDPPRSGCERALLSTIRRMKPKKIVYVSCDPATLARDLDILCHEEGAFYQLDKVQAVDQFVNTFHVETVVCLSNKNSKKKDYVEIGVDAEEYYKIKEGKND